MAKVWKVAGEYRKKVTGGVLNERYEAEFTLECDDEGLARSMIRRGYIVDHLRSSVDGFKSVRTLRIVGSSDAKEHKADGYERALGEAVKKGAMPEQLDVYGTKEEKQAVLESSVVKKNNAEKRKKAERKKVEDQGYID